MMKTKTNDEIIELYNNDMIKFKPIENYLRSLEKIKEIEINCDIHLSQFIENNINKVILCYDSIFPTEYIFDELCLQF